MLDKIVESCRFLLNNYPDARASKSYLDDRLGLETQDTFRFGYFPGIRNMSALADLVGADVLNKEKLLYVKHEIEDILFPRKILSSFFEDHPLVLPFRDAYGKTIGFVGRTLLSDEERAKTKLSKYKNTLFKKSNVLFGLYESKQSILEKDCVYVVEGQFDVIKAHEIGFKNIVALGGSGMSPYQFSVISRYSNNIFLLLDNDEPGQKGRKRIINQFGQYANIRNFYLPEEYKDIDEYITKEKISGYADLSFLVKD